MDDTLKYLIFLTHDQIVFWLLQIILLLIFLYACIYPKYIAYRNERGGVNFTTTREEKSLKYLRNFASGFTSIILAVMISIADVAYGHKVFIFLLDIIIVLYLSYYNDWFRNKLIGIYSRIEQKEEKH